jgi:hypothetical protein
MVAQTEILALSSKLLPDSDDKDRGMVATSSIFSAKAI